jgi:D-alanyl-D-alanine carboxypeptidase/D-alanyl-D-alanine-endopeptidase (penicillin-binding protein 4)
VRHFALVVVAAAVACISSVAATAAPPAPLETTLGKALAGPWVSLARTSAVAVDLSTGAVLFSHNPSLPVAPASNEKVPVSWAALTRLGTGYRFHTEVYGIGNRAGPSWHGDLVLKGFGDPTLTTADLDRLAATIRGRGIRSVTGRVLGDESFYDRKRGAPGWKAYFVGGETPPLSALVVDRGRGWPALSPPLLAARSFRDALVRRGVTIAGRPGLGAAPLTAASLASDDVTDALAGIVQHMNHESDNFYAEMLLKQLAAATGKVGSTAGGGRIVVASMREAGIPVEGVRIVDGSGLSSLDRLPAQALVGVIGAAVADPAVKAAFIGSLAVAGVSGTLRDRLPALRGRLKGKTGTTNMACTLSGLIGGTVAFAVLENGSPVSSWAARSAQDRFVTTLAAAPGVLATSRG